MEGVQTHGWRTALAGSQMLFVAFGALVLMPLITGMNPSVALFTAGIGTLLFQFTTRRQIPIFLASSFAFIAPIMYSNQTWGLPATLGGLVAAGVVYILLSLVIRIWGPGFIQRLLPPVVVGPVIMVIGLGLASVAVNMAMGKAGDGSAQLVEYNTAILIAGASLITTIIVAVYAKGIFRLVPILAGVLVGYSLSWLLGVTDFSNVAAAPWLAVPQFVTPEFQLAAILFMIPVAIAPAIEHIGDVLAIGGVTGKNYLEKPGLQNTLLGDGIATSAAAFFGGPPNTTYSEVTGAVMLTRNFNPNVMIWAAVFAIGLAFVDKFGAVLLGMPVPVMGGILCLLFGSIAVVGLNTLVRNQVDLAQARNLCIVSVTLVFGIGGMVIGNDSFSLQGISLCGVVAIVLNLILPKGEDENALPHQ
ncbi:MAG TPA: uracil permease [Pseudomonas sp.]|nr:uracil permease [Pseudomonas sp.]MAQ51158.1 uracil permease [Pseudomonas sp.]HCA25450.1 uracil permease [Pseudomonas sp.]|tara:strand:+ start:1731 stop:2981 length:1251 start_codon:yes stop_codon:yes gene_type:complete